MPVVAFSFFPTPIEADPEFSAAALQDIFSDNTGGPATVLTASIDDGAGSLTPQFDGWDDGVRNYGRGRDIGVIGGMTYVGAQSITPIESDLTPTVPMAVLPAPDSAALGLLGAALLVLALRRHI